jgi:membrane protein implicated in regulation of membrane protease activity
MSRFSRNSFGRLLRGEGASSAAEVESTEGRAMLEWLGPAGAVLAVCIAAVIALPVLSLAERILLAIAAVLALTVALLLRRHQWFHRALMAERRQSHGHRQHTAGTRALR